MLILKIIIYFYVKEIKLLLALVIKDVSFIKLKRDLSQSKSYLIADTCINKLFKEERNNIKLKFRVKDSY